MVVKESVTNAFDIIEIFGSEMQLDDIEDKIHQLTSSVTSAEIFKLTRTYVNILGIRNSIIIKVP